MRIAQNPNSLILQRRIGGFVLARFRPRPAAASPQACVEGLWPSAKGAGVTRATFDRAFKGSRPIPK